MAGAGEPTLITGDVSKYVKLNVGGCLFQTTIGTLTKYDTMLRGMFSGEVPVQTDSDGFAVIDRSGKHFGVVLNYLRDGDVALPESQRDLQELLAEAEYYRVEGLITGIQAQMRSKNDPKPRCNFCYASSHEEAEELAASESKPVVILELPYEYSNPRSVTAPELLMNLALFDKLCMQYQNGILFVKFTSTTIKCDTRGKSIKTGCSWWFYKQGKAFGNVLCHLTQNNITITTYKAEEVLENMLKLAIWDTHGSSQ